MEFGIGILVGIVLTLSVAAVAYAASLYLDNREPKHKRSTYIAPTRGRHKKTTRV